MIIVVNLILNLLLCERTLSSTSYKYTLYLMQRFFMCCQRFEVNRIMTHDLNDQKGEDENVDDNVHDEDNEKTNNENKDIY